MWVNLNEYWLCKTTTITVGLKYIHRISIKVTRAESNAGFKLGKRHFSKEDILGTSKHIKRWSTSLIIRQKQFENRGDTPLHMGLPGGSAAREPACSAGAWPATFHGVTRVRRNLATKPPLHMRVFVIKQKNRKERSWRTHTS